MEANDRFATYAGPNSSTEAMAILTTMAGPVSIEGPNQAIRSKLRCSMWPCLWTTDGSVRPLVAVHLANVSRRFAKPRADHPGGRGLQQPRHHTNGPMIGRIGVAPREESRRSNDKGVFWWRYGATPRSQRSTVYLPVFHAGGVLTIGDCHAAMAMERRRPPPWNVPFDAMVSMTLEEHCKVSRPVVTTATEVMTTGEGETMEAATKRARQGMADLLVDPLGIDDTEAACSLLPADVRTGLTGHPPSTMRVAVPKTVLDGKALAIVGARTPGVPVEHDTPCRSGMRATARGFSAPALW